MALNHVGEMEPIHSPLFINIMGSDVWARTGNAKVGEAVLMISPWSSVLLADGLQRAIGKLSSDFLLSYLPLIKICASPVNRPLRWQGDFPMEYQL
jgi:hypothetical protein